MAGGGRLSEEVRGFPRDGESPGAVMDAPRTQLIIIKIGCVSVPHVWPA